MTRSLTPCGCWFLPRFKDEIRNVAVEGGLSVRSLPPGTWEGIEGWGSLSEDLSYLDGWVARASATADARVSLLLNEV